jgi:protein-tyrosine phosphatase
MTGEIPPDEAYVYMLDAKDAIRRVFEILAESRGCALFHCMNGKDRTGIIAALLLGMAGACDDDIVRDYEVTYDLIKENEYVVRGIEKYGRAVFLSLPEYMRPVISFVRDKFSTFDDYLLSCGIMSETLERIREKFVSAG